MSKVKEKKKPEKTLKQKRLEKKLKKEKADTEVSVAIGKRKSGIHG